MSVFDLAVKFVLSNEGGLVENKNDSGGITNRGISLRFLQNLSVEKHHKYGIFYPVTEDTIRSLTVDQTILIYRGEFWDEANIQLLNDQYVANYTLDMCVLHGIAPSIKILQRAVWAAYTTFGCIEDDGILGINTARYVNHLATGFLSILMASRASFCRMLVEMNPKNKEFLEGWLKRCYKI